MITGLSGAGRATCLRALEDSGYVAVDNLPLPMVSALFRPAPGTPNESYPVAIGIDVRTRGFDAARVLACVHELRRRDDLDARLLFLDCDNDVLLRRFTETRRSHPLAQDRPVLDGIIDERRRLGGLRDHADMTIDTSLLGPHELKRLLQGQFGQASPGLLVSVMSFSYRRGLPREADLVFDARFLRNPYWDPALRSFSGQDPPVRRYVARDPDYTGFVTGLQNLLDSLLPRFEREGKSYLTVAVGCTGGRHRSVVVAEQLADRLRRQGRPLVLTHRDIDSTAASAAGARKRKEEVGR
ncbi:RNase adapter RapZ [Vineibacter terrae]|uniref:RNase adapter RapZ n=1 Tax=Vineibacter terrae TaxID=2586908 RepID=UPI002E3122F6|nr:RNase adapter RapZ [Vineibacter terrae]HEX2885421.1 RNase adapter RapZ [Vineibacter terrae]